MKKKLLAIIIAAVAGLLVLSVILWSSREPPLIAAVKMGSLDKVRVLLENGAEVDAKTGRGWTSLHIALAGAYPVKGRAFRHLTAVNRLAIVELLLSSGANVNVQGMYGVTPLHLACGRPFNRKRPTPLTATC